MFKSLYTRIAIYTITVMIFSAVASFLCTNIIYHNYLKENNDAKIMRTLKDSIQYQKESRIEASAPFFKHLGEMNYQVMTISEDGHPTYYGTEFRKDNISKKQLNLYYMVRIIMVLKIYPITLLSLVFLRIQRKIPLV